MQKQNKWNRYIYALLFIGILFRVVLFVVSPPSNSYDNHLEPINLYSESLSRTAPFQCWECYQPPAYYYLGGGILKASRALGINEITQWKIVQGINLILSILVLITCLLILIEFNVGVWDKILYMSFIICLPRDILTSAMIGNDYLLVFATVTA